MSDIYEKYTKVVTADFPRFTVHSSIPTGASLSIVFDHYRLSRNRRDNNRRELNLFFMAGTGMTKSIWKYYIRRLFQYSESNSSTLNWQLANCVALDLVNHGDSALENTGLLGWEVDWRDGSHDLIQVAKSLRLSGENVAIGHSMGGFQVLYGSVVSPLLFKFVISIEPVTHRTLDFHNKEEETQASRKLLSGLNRIIQSEFKNEKEFDTYFKKFSFYRNFNNEILTDFLASEKMVNKDGTISTKTSKEQQLLCYLGGFRTFSVGLDILRQITVPVVHVVGAKGKWNSPKDVEEANNCLKHLDLVFVPEGEHLVNGERPEEVLEIIKEKLDKYIGGVSSDDYYGFIEQTIDVVASGQTQEIFDLNYGKISRDYFTLSKPKM